MTSLSYEAVSRLLSYDQHSGEVTWLPRPESAFQNYRAFRVWNARYAGKRGFTAVDAGGYYTGRIMGKTHYLHRIVWLIFYGTPPDKQVDHINGDRLDNRIVNLRSASHSENCRNSKSRSGATSAYLGVSWNTRRQKWDVRIKVGRTLASGGMFCDEIDAARAYDRMAAHHFGEFARLNFPLGTTV